ncbi:hypothetical protein D3C84_1111270 [compost metagenome]
MRYRDNPTECIHLRLIIEVAFHVGDHRGTEQDLITAHGHQIDAIAIKRLHTSFGNGGYSARTAVDVKGVRIACDAALFEGYAVGFNRTNPSQVHDIAYTP